MSCLYHLDREKEEEKYPKFIGNFEKKIHTYTYSFNYNYF